VGARKKNFKIGCFHGKLNPKDASSEAKLRNDLYLIGMLYLNITRTNVRKIRLIGYEVPLVEGQKRGQCIDLLGYDQEYDPYIIELKKKDSKEDLAKIIKQISKYEEYFQNSKHYIEEEIQNKFHWPDFRFSDEPRKIILTDRSYFKGRAIAEYRSYISSALYICSIAKVKSINDTDENLVLLEKLGSKGYVNLKIENRMKGIK
jgi:hypothetical protein